MPFHRVLVEPFDILSGVTSRLVEWEQFDARFDKDIDGRIQKMRFEYAETGRLPDVFRSTATSRIVEIDFLRSGLYEIYVQEPGSVITGTIFPTELQRSEQLTETAVFLPYLDESGVFRIASFIGNRPVSIQSLVVQFSGDYLHAEVLKPDAFVF